MGNKLYDEKSIESLSPLEFTRLRPGVYCGDTTYSTQLLVEILSNAVDEYRLGHGNEILITIDKDVVTVRDYGQGFIPNSFREDGKTILEALNTDLVCDAINTAMRELFLQIVYGRTQSAFSEGGLMIGAGLEDLGKGLRSQVGTLYGTLAKGSRYLEMAEGYINRIALDKNDEICGYEFIHLGKFMDEIKKGTDANEALKKVTGTYGRFSEEAGAVKYIDPRHE